MNDVVRQNVGSTKAAGNGRPLIVKMIAAVYAVVVLVLVLLSASNYPVQWRAQVNAERMRYLEVIVQALQYYTLDHGGEMPALPSGPVMIANSDAGTAYCPALAQELSYYNLMNVLVPGYMKEMLQDPLSSSDIETRFYLSASGRRVVIGACDAFLHQKLEIAKEL